MIKSSGNITEASDKQSNIADVAQVVKSSHKTVCDRMGNVNKGANADNIHPERPVECKDKQSAGGSIVDVIEIDDEQSDEQPASCRNCCRKCKKKRRFN